jgi:DNA invertase Pin-like site-specific DNA recombinase
MGKVVFTVLGAVAELERSFIVERVKAGLRNARAKGQAIRQAAGFRGENAGTARGRSDLTRHRKALPGLKDDGNQGLELAIAALSASFSLPRLRAAPPQKNTGSG